MGEWREFARLRHYLLPYRTVLLGTFVMTVVFDLMVAVEVGLVLACGFFIWRMSTLFSVQAATVPQAPAGVHVVQLYGPLFFGAVGAIERLPEELPAGTRVLVLDLHRMISMDTSGLDALQQCLRQLRRDGCELMLADANAQPLSLMQRTGFAAALGEGGVHPDVNAALQAAARRLQAEPAPARAGDPELSANARSDRSAPSDGGQGRSER